MYWGLSSVTFFRLFLTYSGRTNLYLSGRKELTSVNAKTGSTLYLSKTSNLTIFLRFLISIGS